MLRGWEAGGAVTYPDLPDWPGPPWSCPLVPGWRELAGGSCPRSSPSSGCAPPRRCSTTSRGCRPSAGAWSTSSALLDDPRAELERLCEFVGLEAGEEVTRADAARCATARGPRASEPRDRARRARASCCRAPSRSPSAARELLAKPRRARPAADSSAPADSPLRSVYTQSFPQMLEQLGSSLLVSTYQTGKLICARHDRGRAQHPLPRLRPADGPRGRRRPHRARHPRRGARLPRLPRGRAEDRAAGQARRLLPAAQQPLHRRHPDPRGRLRPGRAVARGDQLLLPGDARRRAQLRPALDAARSSPSWPPRTAAT